MHLADEYHRLRCNQDHVYHKLCLNMWQQKSETCPLCREPIAIENLAFV